MVLNTHYILFILHINVRYATLYMFTFLSSIKKYFNF